MYIHILAIRSISGICAAAVEDCLSFKPIMQNSILLFVLSFFGSGVSDDSFLAKLHQNVYKVKDVRIELMSYNKDFINFCEIKPFKYNRTTTAHNFTFNFKVDIKDRLEVVVQATKFLSNEYRHFPMRFQINAKKCFESNAVGLGSINKCGNFSNFVFYKDISYFACNFMIDDTQFPPLFPNGKYRDEMTFTFLNKEIAFVHFYSEVYTPIKYPKK